MGVTEALRGFRKPSTKPIVLVATPPNLVRAMACSRVLRRNFILPIAHPSSFAATLCLITLGIPKLPNATVYQSWHIQPRDAPAVPRAAVAYTTLATSAFIPKVLLSRLSSVRPLVDIAVLPTPLKETSKHHLSFPLQNNS